MHLKNMKIVSKKPIVFEQNIKTLTELWGHRAMIVSFLIGTRARGTLTGSGEPGRPITITTTTEVNGGNTAGWTRKRQLMQYHTPSSGLTHSSCPSTIDREVSLLDRATQGDSGLANAKQFEKCFILVSQLNGNNGSWTNTDDVDNASNAARRIDHDNRKRTHKEARNHMLHKSARDTRHSKTQYGPPAAPPAATTESSSPTVVTLFIRNPTGSGPYFDGNTYHEHIDEEWLVEPGPPVRCVQHSGGYSYTVSSDQVQNKQLSIMVSTISIVSLPAYDRKMDGDKIVRYPPKTYTILNPVYKKLVAQIGSSQVTPRLADGALSLAIRLCADTQYSDMVNDTVQFFVDTIHWRSSVVLGTSDLMTKVANNAEVVGHGDNGRDTLLATHIGILDVHTVTRIEDREANCPPFDMRDDFVCDNVRGVFDNFDIHAGDIKSPRYRTCFFDLLGHVQQPFVEYSDSANNVNHAIKRLIGARIDEKHYRFLARRTGYWINRLKNQGKVSMDVASMYRQTHFDRQIELPAAVVTQLMSYDHHCKFAAEQMIKLTNQCHRTRLAKIVDGAKNIGKWLYYGSYEKFLTVFEPLLSREFNATIPHVKRMLRSRYVNSVLLHTDDDIMVRKLEVKLKREIAKYGKAPRLTVDYGAGCMYANELPEFVKVCIDGTHVVYHDSPNGVITMCVYIMSKPKSDSLEKAFNDLYLGMSIPNYVQVVIYSDDSCYSGCINGHSFGANVDVSSNDSSQDAPGFMSTYLALRGFHKQRAWGLIRQCMLPLHLSNPQNLDDKRVIKFDTPFEGSGTCITTILNHFGSYAIAMATLSVLAEGNDFEHSVRLGAKCVGHEVTVETWEEHGVLKFENAQFLKRSPVRVDRGWIPSINLGCVLRALGKVENDMESRHLAMTPAEFVATTMSDRMDAFFSSVIAGWCNECANPVLNALRQRFGTGFKSEVREHDSNKYIFTDKQDYSMYTDESFGTRYNLSESEISDLVDSINSIKLGRKIACTAISKIFHKDYGVPLVN